MHKKKYSVCRVKQFHYFFLHEEGFLFNPWQKIAADDIFTLCCCLKKANMQMINMKCHALCSFNQEMTCTLTVLKPFNLHRSLIQGLLYQLDSKLDIEDLESGILLQASMSARL